MIVYVVYSVIEGDRYDFEDAANCKVFASESDAELYRQELESDSLVSYAKIVEKIIGDS